MAPTPRKRTASVRKNIIEIDGRGHRPWAVVSKEKLLNAAVAEIAERGFEHARLVDIAARADLTVGAIYNWFKNRAELFTAAVEYAITQQHEANSEYLSTDSAEFHTGYRKNHWILRIAALSPRQANDSGPTNAQKLTLEALRVAWRDEESQGAIAPQVSALLSQYEEIVRDAMRDGHIDASLDPKVIARIFMALPVGLSMLTLSGLPDVDPFKYIDVFQRLDSALKPRK